MLDEEQGINGIWVASVESGSPADTAGILPGDIITRLEGLDLALDGTMSDYCDIIRTQGADATMSLEVLRFSTEEVYEGQLNGDPLTLSFSFAQTYRRCDRRDDPAAATDTYTEYVNISDDSGSISTDVPVEWADIDGAPNPDFGPSLYAAPNLDEFTNTFGTPGVIIEATSALDLNDINSTLDEINFADSCTYDGRSPYADPLYAGSIDTWSNCGGIGAIVFVVAVMPADGSYLARVLIQAVEEHATSTRPTRSSTRSSPAPDANPSEQRQGVAERDGARRDDRGVDAEVLVEIAHDVAQDRAVGGDRVVDLPRRPSRSAGMAPPNSIVADPSVARRPRQSNSGWPGVDASAPSSPVSIISDGLNRRMSTFESGSARPSAASAAVVITISGNAS